MYLGIVHLKVDILAQLLLLLVPLIVSVIYTVGADALFLLPGTVLDIAFIGGKTESDNVEADSYHLQGISHNCD